MKAKNEAKYEGVDGDDNSLYREKLDGAFVLHETPVKKWKCSRGHAWESRYVESGVSFHPGGALLVAEAEHYCGQCFLELAREKMGRVREVK